jgi:hypothetical protein
MMLFLDILWTFSYLTARPSTSLFSHIIPKCIGVQGDVLCHPFHTQYSLITVLLSLLDNCQLKFIACVLLSSLPKHLLSSATYLQSVTCYCYCNYYLVHKSCALTLILQLAHSPKPTSLMFLFGHNIIIMNQTTVEGRFWFLVILVFYKVAAFKSHFRLQLMVFHMFRNCRMWNLVLCLLLSLSCECWCPLGLVVKRMT